MSEATAEEGWVQRRIPEERADQARSLAIRIVTEPFRRRSWAELWFFLTSSALAILAAFALAAMGFAGLVLSVVFIGVLVLAGGLGAARTFGRWQRSLGRRVIGDEIQEPGPVSARPGFFGWLRAHLGDLTAWRAVGYFVLKVPLTIFGIWFALTLWVEAIARIASPITGSTVSTRFGPAGIGIHGASGPGLEVHVAEILSGLVLLLIAPWTTRLVVYLDRQLMHLLLGPDGAASRVTALEQSRTKTIDAAAETLRRIERDLHDGTQAQLVALAMRLGQAIDELDHLPAAQGDADLADVRRLVDEAHRGAKEAIVDLRDMARGIHPPALDTGLENALATLAARSSVPTELTVTIEVRPAPAIEAIAYFCAAELLANVAQHAQASRAALTCAQHGPWLRIVVRDDGAGGAAINRVGSTSSGLAGLGDRVGAVDGHLSVVSPPGGPTAVTVDLPIRT